ncbi:MAG: YHS domain-containing protein [Pirellulales bacterium]|nr:YHS domain-containing protein [Pirellulales bacterium]
MKPLLCVLSLAVALAATSRAVMADESAAAEKKEFQATCPVSGGPATEENSVEYRGKKVYFCCEKCPKAFAQDPKKFKNNVLLQLLETAQMVQVGCPLSGGPTDEETAVEVGHAKVAFCCEKCQGKFKQASDEEKLKLLFANLTKAFTLQSECPVSGKPINPKAFVEHDGKKVYFCCEGCPKAFTADPEKYLAKLPQFQDDDEQDADEEHEHDDHEDDDHEDEAKEEAK